MFSLRQRILVIASARDSDAIVAFQNYSAPNADKILLEDLATKFPSGETGRAKYASVSLFASRIDFDKVSSMEVMLKLFGLIQPGGIMNFHLAFKEMTDDTVIEKFKKALIYAGFIEPHITRDKENARHHRTIQATSGRTNERDEFMGQTSLWDKRASCIFAQLVGQRPSWAVGRTTDGLIDEATLLDDEEYVPLGKGRSDCATKPRACDNCTCGRKELEVQLGAEEAKRRLENATVRSSCGNCYLGDAFRCAGCPYKGQPAFKPGEKVQLDIATAAQDAVFLGDSDNASIQTGTGGTLQLKV